MFLQARINTRLEGPIIVCITNIEFLEKAGGFVASVINSVTVAQKMRDMLMETQAQTERLKSQEEELRQNLEEMQATQEQLIRSKNQ